ncbi:MAG: hypothetical protein KDD60_01340, partial [Bdellovibrionales bacterium]|nr:hypothetical protein [Bdellovibrionales bacterium]
YAPRIFSDVVSHLQRAGVVMGQCEFTNKEGETTEVVRNIPRNWFDIWKYWVYHSCPAQPAIFFRREVLENAMRAPDRFLDEDLYFGMDFDLWLRMAERFPFTTTSSRTYSYFRMYEENKSGKDGAIMYREASRIFRRHGNRRSLAERRASIVIPTTTISPDFEATLRSCYSQNLTDFEIIVWYRGERSASKEVSDYVSHIANESGDSRFRFFQATHFHSSFASDLIQLSTVVRSPVLLIVNPGQLAFDDAVHNVSNIFDQDSLSALILTGGNEELRRSLIVENEGREIFSIQSLFSGVDLPRSCAFRTLALQELSEVQFHPNEALSLLEILIFMQYKAWAIQVIGNGIVQNLPPSAMSPFERVNMAPDMYQAHLIDRVATLRENDAFAEIRSEHGFIIEFPETTVHSAREFLRQQ